MSERQRDHAKEYIRQLNLNKERNLGEKMCHGIAAAVAKEKFRLEPEEQLAVDAWLDERYPARKKEEEKIVYPLFDVPRVQ